MTGNEKAAALLGAVPWGRDEALTPYEIADAAGVARPGSGNLLSRMLLRVPELAASTNEQHRSVYYRLSCHVCDDLAPGAPCGHSGEPWTSTFNCAEEEKGCCCRRRMQAHNLAIAFGS